MSDTPSFFESPHGRRIAYHARLPETSRHSETTWIYCSGFTSNMENDKALFFDQVCLDHQINFVRFDYSGHGLSGSEFGATCFGDWYQDFQDLVNHLDIQGPISLFGASMGGFIAMKAAKLMAGRIQDLMLFAPAADLGSALIWPLLSDEIKAALKETGIYDAPENLTNNNLPLYLHHIEESMQHNILDGQKIKLSGKIRIIHGTEDDLIPVSHSLRCLDILEGQDEQLLVIKGADHLIDRVEDLIELKSTFENLLTA